MKRVFVSVVICRRFGPSRALSKAALADAGTRLVVADTNFIQARTSKQPGGRQWFPARPARCRLLAGRMATDSLSWWTTAVVYLRVTAIFRISTSNSIRRFRAANYSEKSDLPDVLPDRTCTTKCA